MPDAAAVAPLVLNAKGEVIVLRRASYHSFGSSCSVTSGLPGYFRTAASSAGTCRHLGDDGAAKRPDVCGAVALVKRSFLEKFGISTKAFRCI